MEPDLLAGSTEGVPNGKNPGVKQTQNIPGVGFFHNFPVLSHHLLRLGKLHLFVALDMVHLHALFKPAGTNPHKSHPVPVGLIHIGLDFKDETRKIGVERIHFPFGSLTSQRRGGHL